MRKHLLFAALLILSASGAAACDTEVTDPEIPTTAVTSYQSRLQEKGSAWRSITTTVSGTVTVQLASVSQPDVVMRIGIGTVSGTNCNVTQSTETVANSLANSPQITATLGVGTYCVKISDIGNLTTIVDFLIVIVTPI